MKTEQEIKDEILDCKCAISTEIESIGIAKATIETIEKRINVLEWCLITTPSEVPYNPAKEKSEYLANLRSIDKQNKEKEQS